MVAEPLSERAINIMDTTQNDIKMRSRDSFSQNSTPQSPTNPPRRHAVLIIAAGFIANFMVFGIAFTYGVFQEFYSSVEGPLSSSSHAAVAMIGTVASAMTYMCAIFYNTALKYIGNPRTVMLLGSIFMGLGLIVSSFCREYEPYQFILSQGLLFGLGASMVYIPPVVCAPPYYTRHRGIALGVLFSGTGMGALALSPLTSALITNLGWRWALRVLGFISLASTSAASFMVHQHPTLRGKVVPLSQTFNYKAVDLLSLSSQLSAGFFQSAGYLISINYMSTYAETLGFSAKQGANFIAINNGVNAVFKVVLGHLADRTGRLNMIVLCNLASALCVLVLWMISTKGTFISFVILYGVFSGAIISLLPTCLSEIFGTKNYQSISGLMYFFRGVGNFLGSPIAGLLIANNNYKKGYQTSRDYQNAIIYNGVLLLTSTLFLVYLRLRVLKSLAEIQRD